MYQFKISNNCQISKKNICTVIFVYNSKINKDVSEIRVHYIKLVEYYKYVIIRVWMLSHLQF